MGTIDWINIKAPPKGLHMGIQTIRIESVREYRNGSGNRCVELVLANDEGGCFRDRFSVERNNLTRIQYFLHSFLTMDVADVVTHGGWESLIGREFIVDVDFPDGQTPRLEPCFF